MQKRGGYEDERCCSCGAPLETSDHLFQCPKRPQFKRRILAAITEMQTKLCPSLYYILYNGVAEYIGDSSTKTKVLKKTWEIATDRRRQRDNTNTNTTLRNFSMLQTEQQEIGWDNLLRGKFSKKWKEIQKWHKTTNRFQRNQRNVRLRMSRGGYIRNPYDDDKEKKEKKQKKEKDIFQSLIKK